MYNNEENVCIKYEKKVLFENFLSLSVLQLVVNVLPLFLYSYFAFVLGKEKFGLILFVFSLINYFLIFCDFGFDLSATREIALNRHNKNSLSYIFNSILILKTVFVLISFVFLLILVLFVPKFSINKQLIFFSFGIVVGSSCFSTWFFQGIEKMKYIAFFKILSQVLLCLLIFFYIKQMEDYLLVPFFYSFEAIFATLIALFVIFRKFGIKFFIPKYIFIKKQFIYSLEFFLSKASLSILNNTNIFCLGLVSSSSIVCLYAVAEKIYLTLKSFQSPIFNVLYPCISKYKNINFYKRIFKFGMLFNIFICAILYCFSSNIINFLYGIDFINANQVFKVFLILQLVSFPSIILGYPLLGALGYTKFVNVGIVISTIIHIILLYGLYLLGILNIYSVVYLLIVTETILLLIKLYFIYKHRIFAT